MRLYFVQPVGGGPIKIGASVHPERRFSVYLTWSPVPLDILVDAPGDYLTEAYLHYKFRSHRLHHEWFKDVPEIRTILDTTKKTGRIPGVPTTAELAGQTLSPYVQALRVRLRLSRAELAEALGVTHGTVKLWEAGGGRFAGSTAGKLIAFAEEHRFDPLGLRAAA